jgi:hypothetical protein
MSWKGVVRSLAETVIFLFVTWFIAALRPTQPPVKLMDLLPVAERL